MEASKQFRATGIRGRAKFNCDAMLATAMALEDEHEAVVYMWVRSHLEKKAGRKGSYLPNVVADAAADAAAQARAPMAVPQRPYRHLQMRFGGNASGAGRRSERAWALSHLAQEVTAHFLKNSVDTLRAGEGEVDFITNRDSKSAPQWVKKVLWAARGDRLRLLDSKAAADWSEGGAREDLAKHPCACGAEKQDRAHALWFCTDKEVVECRAAAVQAIKSDTRGKWLHHERVHDLVRRLEGKQVAASQQPWSEDVQTTRCALGLIPGTAEGFAGQFKVSKQLRRGVQLIAGMLSASVRLTQPIRSEGLEWIERRRLLNDAWVTIRERAFVTISRAWRQARGARARLRAGGALLQNGERFMEAIRVRGAACAEAVAKEIGCADIIALAKRFIKERDGAVAATRRWRRNGGHMRGLVKDWRDHALLTTQLVQTMDCHRVVAEEAERLEQEDVAGVCMARTNAETEQLARSRAALRQQAWFSRRLQQLEITIQLRGKSDARAKRKFRRTKEGRKQARAAEAAERKRKEQAAELKERMRRTQRATRRADKAVARDAANGGAACRHLNFHPEQKRATRRRRWHQQSSTRACDTAEEAAERNQRVARARFAAEAKKAAATRHALLESQAEDAAASERKAQAGGFAGIVAEWVNRPLHAGERHATAQEREVQRLRAVEARFKRAEAESAKVPEAWNREMGCSRMARTLMVAAFTNVKAAWNAAARAAGAAWRAVAGRVPLDGPGNALQQLAQRQRQAHGDEAVGRDGDARPAPGGARPWGRSHGEVAARLAQAGAHTAPRPHDPG